MCICYLGKSIYILVVYSSGFDRVLLTEMLNDSRRNIVHMAHHSFIFSSTLRYHQVIIKNLIFSWIALTRPIDNSGRPCSNAEHILEYLVLKNCMTWGVSYDLWPNCFCSLSWPYHPLHWADYYGWSVVQGFPIRVRVSKDRALSSLLPVTRQTCR